MADGETSASPARDPSRSGAPEDRVAREGRRKLAMAKAEIVGTVVSNKMAKSVVVTVERLVRHQFAARLWLATATISVLGFERETPAVRRWNAPVR